jgi:hypothetical protein
MTEHDDEDLDRLFERTAAEPSSFELTRMAARARELPGRLERVPRRLPRWTWAPAFAAVAALGALGVTLTQTLAPDADPATPSARPTAPSSKKPIVSAPENSSARAKAPASSDPSGDPGLSEDDLDALSLTPEADDDPFDLSNAEEMELSR